MKLLLFPCSTPSVPIYIICIYNIMVIICWMYLKSSFNSVHHQFLYYYITFVYYYYYYNMVCLLCEHTCCDDCASPHARTTYVVYFFKIERSNTVLKEHSPEYRLEHSNTPVLTKRLKVCYYNCLDIPQNTVLTLNRIPKKN